MKSRNKIKKILIVNRGEIAFRILQAGKELGCETAIVYSRFDDKSKAVLEADESIQLQGEDIADTYLDQGQILKIAKDIGAEAIHPGYGFLAENWEFAKKCHDSGIRFVGPAPETLRSLGDKIASKQLAKQAQVPVIPGIEKSLTEDSPLTETIKELGYPVLIKAAAGGGGKGMRVVREKAELSEALAGARREAKAYFGNENVFLEKYIEKPRHIEVQILGDEQGNILHLGERECSIQRRHQKMIEESPSPSIGDSVRTQICEAAVRLAQEAHYVSAGTVEFLVDPEDRFYFLEVNTRLQVEHPVTEWVTGIDLVKAQIKIAEGHELPITQKNIHPRGHAIECRLYAEDPENDFLPSEGRVEVLEEPRRPGVRVDSALQAGYDILSLYDPLLAKLIVYGANRKEALDKMDALLRDYILLGIRHNLDFLRHILKSEEFSKGRYHTHSAQGLLEQFLKDRETGADIPPVALAVASLAERTGSSSRTAETPENDPLIRLRGFRNA